MLKAAGRLLPMIHFYPEITFNVIACWNFARAYQRFQTAIIHELCTELPSRRLPSVRLSLTRLWTRRITRHLRVALAKRRENRRVASGRDIKHA
jgi:hypothetical protein